MKMIRRLIAVSVITLSLLVIVPITTAEPAEAHGGRVHLQWCRDFAHWTGYQFKQGDRGDCILNLQHTMNIVSFLRAANGQWNWGHIGEDGIFGQQTRNALTWYHVAYPVGEIQAGWRTYQRAYQHCADLVWGGKYDWACW